MKKIIALIAAVLLTTTLFADVVYEPLIVADGFNRDVIAETYPYTASSVSYYQPYSTSPTAAYYTTHNHATKEVIRLTNDAENRGLTDAQKEYLATETGWPNDYGNPGDRIVNCRTDRYPGLYWELAPYTAENALCLRDSTKGCVNSGSLTFKNIGCYQKLCFLTFAGGVATGDTPASAQKRQMKATVYYSTGEPDVHQFEFLDCAGVKPERQAHICQIYSNGFVKGTSSTNTVYAAVSEMNVDTHRLIDSVHFAYTGSASTGIAIFAVTGMTADIVAPASGSSLKTTDISNNSFVASWEAVEGAKTYRIDVATDEDFHHMVDGFNNEAVITGTDTIIEGLGANSEYYWRVRAVDNEGGQSASSSPRRVRTAPEDGMAGPATRENDEDIEADIADWLDMDMASIDIYRTLYRDGYFNTICLPFNLDPAGIAASPIAGCELFEYVSAVKSESQLDISIRPIDHIVAGVPYLIRWTNRGDIIPAPLTFYGVHIERSTGLTIGSANDIRFVGHIGQEQIPFENRHNLFVGANNTLYWPNTTDNKMKGFRAYFAIPEVTPSGVPIRRGTPARLVYGPNDMPTALDSVGDIRSDREIRIENSQIVILLNGKKYNLAGQEIQ